MSKCLVCEETERRKKREAYQKLLIKAKDFAKEHNLKILYIVQTKNFPNFKRAQDVGNYPIIETLLFD